MQNKGSIIVLTSFSKESMAALKRGCALAARLNVEVHLLHLVSALAHVSKRLDSTSQLQQLKLLESEIVEKLLAEQGRSVAFPLATHIEEAGFDPASVICDFAKRHQAQLIVLGRNTHQGILERTLRHTATIRYGVCSLLVTTDRINLQHH